MPFGEAPPGARGVLGFGQVLKMADYSLAVALLPPTPRHGVDPWAVFDRDATNFGGATPGSPEAAAAAAARALLATEQRKPEDDPFGDWGFETTFGSGSKDGDALDAASLAQAGDLTPFFRGLGLDAGQIGPLSQGELETIGRLVRVAMLGLFQLQGPPVVAAPAHQPLPEQESTVPAVDGNPLRTGWPDEVKLRYLFGGHAASGGMVRPERALRELLGELIAHDRAVDRAAHEAVEATLREFSPAALKARLLGSGTKLFEGARAWEAFTKYYGEQARELPAWAQKLLDRYFTEAYLRESLRIKGETSERPR
ncbi:MAG: type VI secretion system-associated FHA domain protein, partial [Ramlibacter sp.]